MFCNQSRFDLPTRVITLEQFRALVRAPRTVKLVSEARAALANGDKALYDRKKRQLPLMVFIGTFEESEKEVENKKTGEKRTVKGCWRVQSHVCLNGLVVADYDHLEGDVREIWAKAFEKLSDEDKARIVLVYVTPSGHGLKVVFTADAGVGNLIDNQLDFSAKLGLPLDESCKDASRGAFMTTAEDIISINEEKLFAYENKAFAEKYNAEYRAGNSGATKTAAVARKDDLQRSGTVSKVDVQEVVDDDTIDTSWNGQDIQPICDAWSAQRFGGGHNVSRHEASVVLARDLYIMYDRDQRKTLKALLAQPWVQAIIQERGEDVERTVSNAAAYVAAQESENAKKGKPWLPKISKEMKAVLAEVGDTQGSGTSVTSQATSQMSQTPSDAEDIYGQLPLDKWAEELQEMAEVYPCMKELFLNAHPHKLPAILFSSAALFGTLMTRAYYHFWYEPEVVRRLNYCIFIIGDPGAGKNIVEKFYKKIADPMIQADQCLIDAVNRYKDGRTERTTSTKAQKGDALKRPVVGIRVHPARTATGEFIRHMNAAVETIQGQPLHLHMFSFDAELDNVTKQNKGGDWKDREIMELKAFHNEEDGQMYANQESITGMFNVFWNFIYTGTPYALHRKVNQRNFGTGMSTRLAVIPLPDKGYGKSTPAGISQCQRDAENVGLSSG